MKSSVHPENQQTLTPSWSLLPKSIELVKTYFVPLLYVSILPSLLITLSMTYSHGRTVQTANGHTMTSYGVFGTLGHNPLSITLFAIGMLWSVLSIAAKVYVQLRAVEGKSVGVAQSFRKSAKYILPLIGLTLVTLLIISIGFLLLIVPGFIFLRRYYLAPYYLVDRNVTIREALRLSAAESKPAAGYIWGLFGVMFVLSLVGLFIGSIPLGIGAVLTTFISLSYAFGPALRYKELGRGLQPSLGTDWSTIED